VLQDYGLLLKRTEVEQRRVADAIAVETGKLVSEAVSLIAGRDFPTIPVGLEQITFKPKGVETKMVMSALDRQRRHELVDSQGKIVLLVVADPSAFMGSRGAAKIEALAAEDEEPAAEPELPLAADAGEGGDLGETSGNAIAREDGYIDGLLAVRDHAARWAPGVFGHGDYALGYADGERRRAEAQDLGAEAGRRGDDQSTNPYAEGSAEASLWLARWMAPDPGKGNPPEADEAPKRRGRRAGAEASA
jgi:hypothetical protein